MRQAEVEAYSSGPEPSEDEEAGSNADTMDDDDEGIVLDPSAGAFIAAVSEARMAAGEPDLAVTAAGDEPDQLVIGDRRRGGGVRRDPNSPWGGGRRSVARLRPWRWPFRQHAGLGLAVSSPRSMGFPAGRRKQSRRQAPGHSDNESGIPLLT